MTGSTATANLNARYQIPRITDLDHTLDHPMIHADAHTVLLDIEGTTSTISYVHEVLFPYAQRQARTFLQTGWDQPDVQHALQQMARDAGSDDLYAWFSESQNRDEQVEAVMGQVEDLMQRDAKTTGLKALQGLIWREGFQAGELQAHVFDDVPPALRRWKDRGLDIRIYSSGSVEAQRVFFAHTVVGDLTSHFSGHYDTSTGPKTEPQSYRIIAEDIGIPTEQLLFLSDAPAELDAARKAGAQTALAIRPGNRPVDTACDHPAIYSFDEVEVQPVSG